jgi:glycosyltransferase involved in cell wall biosynthesis
VGISARGRFVASAAGGAVKARTAAPRNGQPPAGDHPDIMNILLCSTQAYLPQASGGAQTSTHELAIELTSRGHHVAVLAGMAGNGWIAFRNRILMKLTGRHLTRDTILTYPVFRAWFPWQTVGELLDAEKPDVAVLASWQCIPLAKALRQYGIPVVIYLRDVEFHDLGGNLAELPGAVYIANSQFTADRYRQEFGIGSTVIPPLFRPELYRTTSTRKYVTFINPDPRKGRDLAFAIAERCPRIPFLFVEAWALKADEKERLSQRIGLTSNVTFKPRTSDMREVYGETRILLVPSQWEEAWGRVVSEAHYSGIPVVAARRGGLAESVGDGGLLIEPDAPVERWVETIQSLWNDEDYYRRLSGAAYAFAARPALDRHRQIDLFCSVIQMPSRRLEPLST